MSGCCGEDRWDEVSSGQGRRLETPEMRGWAEAGLWPVESVTPASELMSPGGSWHTNVRCSRAGKYSENWWVHLAGAVFWALAVLSALGCECWPSVRLTPSQARTGRVMGTRALCNDAGDTSPANKESPMCFTPSSIHLISAMQTWWRKWMLFRNNQRKMLYCDAECWADTKSSFHSVV